MEWIFPQYSRLPSFCPDIYIIFDQRLPVHILLNHAWKINALSRLYLFLEATFIIEAAPTGICSLFFVEGKIAQGVRWICKLAHLLAWTRGADWNGGKVNIANTATTTGARLWKPDWLNTRVNTTDSTKWVKNAVTDHVNTHRSSALTLLIYFLPGQSHQTVYILLLFLCIMLLAKWLCWSQWPSICSIN